MTLKDDALDGNDENGPSSSQRQVWVDNDDLEDLSDVESSRDDPIFNSIKEQISQSESWHGSCSTLASEAASSTVGVKYADSYVSLPYGLQPKAAYCHAKKSTDIIGVTYNGRTRQFILLDSKGITLWSKDALNEQDAVERPLQYPKYEYRLFTNVIYARKYNVYFALGKDFALKVLNRDFQEICHVRSDLSSILFMIFNPVRDELITGGVAGTKIWSYRQVSDKMWTEIKHMANYRLFLKTELKNVGGSWVKRVDLDLLQQHLYCCSDMDLFAYDMDGKRIFKFERAHSMSITGCVYSPAARLLVTASVDTEVKVWSITGGLVHTFRGHARAVSNVLLHPETSMLVLTASLDGTVRLWSLETMDCLYNISMTSEGILWMGMTDDNFLYVGSLRSVTLWSLNRVAEFWATARNRLTKLALTHGENKTTRLLAYGDDSSIRVFSRINQKNLSTVLPPPCPTEISAKQGQTVAYNRVYSVAYMLITAREVWVYTTRTDPACRIAVWNLVKIQQELLKKQGQDANTPGGTGGSGYKPAFLNKGPTHRATQDGHGNEDIAECLCLCYLNSHVQMWTDDEGFVCPIQHVYLLFGLSDGRILFMDPVVQGKKYLEFKVNKDAILDIKHDTFHNTLMTMCDLGDAYQIQIWSLPELTLLHEVFAPADIIGFIRLNSSVVTAHRSGCVMCHELLSADDNPLMLTFRPKFSVLDDSATNVSFDPIKADHAGPVLAIDVCPNLEIFCTCSGDGVIKVWQENKVLLTEIYLEESLCAACFLNDTGDLLVGFKNHIFFIDSKKVCPMIPRQEIDDEEFEKESDIYEDPAVKYEGVLENPDPVNLKSYLVPYDIDFSKDFIEGKKPLLPEKGQDAEDGASESGLSCAPTDIYLTPAQSPGRLSLVDLTLDAEPSRNDLRRQMALMLQGKPHLMGPSSGVRFADDEEVDEEMMRFEFPAFGISPGPTPSPSTPSMCTPTSFCVSEGGESTEVEEEPSDGFKPITKPKGSNSTAAKKVAVPVAVKEKPPERPSMKDKLDALRVDSQAVIQKAAKKQAKEVKASDHEHVTKEDLQLLQELDAAPRRKEIKKKEAKSNRKRPRTAEKKAKRKARLDEERIDNIHREEPTSIISKTFQNSDDDISTQSGTPRQKPTVRTKSKSKKQEESSDEESEEDTETKPSAGTSYTPKAIPKSSVEIRPSKVGAGGRAGVDSSQRKRVGARKHMIEPEAVQGGADPQQGVTLTNGQSEDLLGNASTESFQRVKSEESFSDEDLPLTADQSESFSRPTTANSTTGKSDSSGQYQTSKDDNAEGQSQIMALSHGRKTKDEKYGVLQDWLTAEEPVTTNTDEDEDYNEEDLMDSLDDAGAMTLGIDKVTTKSILRAKSAASTRPSSSSIKVGFKDTGEDGTGDGSRQSLSRVGTPASRASTSLFGAAASQQDGSIVDGISVQRSWSPTIYSDYGSEWTNAPLTEDTMFQMGKLGDEEKRDYLYGQRATSAFVGHPGTPIEGLDMAEKTERTRPHTAHVFPDSREELEKMFDEALMKYQGIPGSAEYIPKLYQNEGNKFDENYHYRLIDRHHLLRMQRELRAQSANERRQLLQLRKREKQKGLKGHEQCDGPKLNENSKTDAILDLLQQMLTVDKPGDKQKHEPTGHPSIPRTRTQSARPATGKHRQSMQSRPQTASTSLMCRPGYPVTKDQVPMYSSNQEGLRSASAPGPYSQEQGGRGLWSESQSQPGDRAQSTMSSRPQSAALHKSDLSSELPFRISILIKKDKGSDPSDKLAIRSAPPSAGVRKERPTSSSHSVPIVSVQNRCKLKEDKLSPKFIYSTQHNKQNSSLNEMQVKLMDPRQTNSFYRRLPSRSIPSKCSQYILVGPKKKSQEITPTPLEEQLIVDRFPGWQEKWLPSGPVYTRQKPFQKISYSPQPVT